MISLTGGEGTGVGGDVFVSAGASTATSGGSVVVFGGEGVKTSSGDVFLRTANAGKTGVSGMLVFSSGTSKTGASGKLLIGSGAATGGSGGAVTISVGSGTSGAGGKLTLSAGQSTVLTGGALVLTSGEGTVTSSGSVLAATAATLWCIAEAGGRSTVISDGGARALLRAVEPEVTVVTLAVSHGLRARAVGCRRERENTSPLLRVSSSFDQACRLLEWRGGLSCCLSTEDKSQLDHGTRGRHPCSRLVAVRL